MANNFFSQFPQIRYNIDGEGNFINLTNIVKNVDVDDFLIDKSTSYTFYDVSDGERPDIVSYKLYKNPNYYWTFFILNNNLRAGIGSAWPLSYQQFDRMIEREYDSYSAISILPLDYTDAGSGHLILTTLEEEYKQYLRLVSENKLDEAKILKFDNHLHQIVVYDVVKVADGLQSSVDSFVKNSTQYYLAWRNPYEIGTADYQQCETLRRRFVTHMYSVYEGVGAVPPFPELIGSTPAEIEDEIIFYKSAYIFDKFYKAANLNFRWVSYRNAAALYYDGDQSKSAYDILINENVIDPKYISFFEKESIENEKKSKIRVIAPDKMNRFITQYFELLNYAD